MYNYVPLLKKVKVVMQQLMEIASSFHMHTFCLLIKASNTHSELDLKVMTLHVKYHHDVE